MHRPEIYLGVHGGVTASMVQFSPTVPNMSPITDAVVLGGNGGLVFRWSGQKCCAVQVELNYLQRGWREANAEGAYTRALHYIELPFLMHIYFGSQTVRGFVNLGPQIGYCVYDNGGNGTRQTSEVHQYSPVEKPFDWGITGGLGFYVRSRNAGLYQLEVRYNYSLGTLFDASLTAHFRNSNPMELSINLAWLWEFKR
ncbi:MAG: porin family protein [Paludibacteraceae bacterium]